MQATATRTQPTEPSRTNGSSSRFVADDPTDAELVSEARAGSSTAWKHLADRYSRLVWHVIRSFRLSNAAAEDVSQIVWLKAIENLDRVHDPERIGAWLTTTARRAAIAELHRAKKQVPVAPETRVFDCEAEETPDRLVADEVRTAMTEAFESLSESDQQLLRLSVMEEQLSYEQVANIVHRPIGSIGPSRARALTKLHKSYSPLIGDSLDQTRRTVGPSSSRPTCRAG